MADMADPRRIIEAYKYPGEPQKFPLTESFNTTKVAEPAPSAPRNPYEGSILLDPVMRRDLRTSAETLINYNGVARPAGNFRFGPGAQSAHTAGEVLVPSTSYRPAAHTPGSTPASAGMLPAHIPGAQVRPSYRQPETGYNPDHLPAFRGSQEQFIKDEGVTPLEYGGNVGYFSTGGAKPVLTDAGEPGRALNGVRNGVVAGQKVNSADLIGNIISRQPDFAGIAQYNADVAKAQKINEMQNGGYKTAADFGGDGSNSSADNLAARKARSYNLNIDQQMKQAELANTNSYRQGTLAIAGRKQTLEEAMAPVEMASKQALSGYYRSMGKASEAKVGADHAIEVQKLKNEQAQKTAELRNASPMAKANADFFTSLGTQAGLAPVEAEAGYKAGFRKPQKAKTHLFSADEQQGLVDPTGKLYTPGAEAAPLRTGTRPNGEVWGEYADGTKKRIR